MPIRIKAFVIALLVLPFAATEAKAVGACHFNKLELSPDGQKALVWKDASVPINQSKRWNSTRQFALASRGGNVEIRRTRSLLTNLQWLQNSDSFVAFTDAGWRYEIDSTTGIAQPSGKRNAAYSSIHLTLQSYVTRAALDKLARLRPPTDEELRERLTKTPVFVLGDDVFWLKNVGGLSRPFDKVAAVSLPVAKDRSNLYAMQSAGIDLAGSEPTVVGLGFPGHQSATAFSKPLFDRSTGRVIGYFSPLLVSSSELNPSTPFARETPAAILDASFNGSTIATLETDIYGSLIVRFRSGDGDHPVKVCPMTEGLPEDGRKTGFDVIELEADSGLAFGLLHHRSSAHNSRLAVRFGGGPLANPLEGLQSPVSSMLAEANIDQVIVSYPGSLGSGYSSSTAFSDFDPKSLDSAATVLKNWITAQQYEEIVITGESFGALPAYVLAKALNSDSASTHLIVPLTQFSSSGVQLGTANTQSLEAQKRYERAVFGSGDNLEAISSYYSSIFAENCPSVLTFVYFAEDDNRIDEDRLPACLAVNSRSHIYEGAGHDDIFRSPEFLKDLRANLLTDFAY